MSLYTGARLATLAMQVYCWCLEVSQGLPYQYQCTQYQLFQVLTSLWDLGSKL